MRRSRICFDGVVGRYWLTLVLHFNVKVSHYRRKLDHLTSQAGQPEATAQGPSGAPATLRPGSARPGCRSAPRCRDSGSMSSSSVSTLLFTPACSPPRGRRARRARRGPSRAGSRRRRASRASVTSTGASISPARERTRAVPPSVRPSALGVVRVDVHRAADRALHERLEVVHPRVVRAQRAGGRPAPCRRSRRSAERRARDAPRRPRSAPAPARPSPTASSACPAGAARAGRGRCRAAPPRGRRASGRRGRRASIRSRIRSGRGAALGRRALRRRRSAAICCRHGRRDEVVDRLDVGVPAPWPRRIAGQPQQRLPLLRHAGSASNTGGE